MAAPELDPVTSASGDGPGRPCGYADLRSYAPIGDTRTVALVALDGRIDWWPIPDLDSCPTFAAILDARGGGRLELGPVEPARTTRRYLPGTNVLETTHVTGSGTVRVVDALNTGGAGRLPWTELARRVEGVAGRVDDAVRGRPRDVPQLGVAVGARHRARHRAARPRRHAGRAAARRGRDRGHRPGRTRDVPHRARVTPPRRRDRVGVRAPAPVHPA